MLADRMGLLLNKMKETQQLVTHIVSLQITATFSCREKNLHQEE